MFTISLPLSEEVLLMRLLKELLGNLCVFRERTEYVFFNFYLLNQGEVAHFLAMIKFVSLSASVCE